MHWYFSWKISTGLNGLKMDKKLEEIYEKNSVYQVANLRKKFTTALEPFCWLKSIVWTLIKNMRSPDLWFFHGKTTTNLHRLKVDKKLQEVSKKTVFSCKSEEKKIYTRPGASVGWNWTCFGHYSIVWNPWIFDFHMPKCQPTSTASGRTRNLNKSRKKPVLNYYITDLKKINLGFD